MHRKVLQKEGRKGHDFNCNSIIYIFVFISFVTFTLSFYLILDSTINYNFTIPIFQFHDSYFTNFNFIITFTILISSL